MPHAAKRQPPAVVGQCFALAYEVGLGVPRTTMLSAVLIASAANTPAVVLIALLSGWVVGWWAFSLLR